jgi:hypothetical protein
MVRVASKPSISGICKSINTISNFLFFTLSTPIKPFSAKLISAPHLYKNFEAIN